MFFLPLLLRFTKETDRLCKVVLHDCLRLALLSRVGIMKIANRVDVSVFKQFREYCDKWMSGSDARLRRAGLVALLFLTQGRGQVVRGDIPRIASLVQKHLPHSLRELKDVEVTELVSEQGSSAELNLYSREDGAKLESLIRDGAVSDEVIEEDKECSLYELSMGSLSPSVDWYLELLLLVELYERFTEPMHACMSEQKELLDSISLLLLSRHLYPRVEATIFFQWFFQKELVRSSACDASSWLAAPGSVFLVLQRLLIMYHLPHSRQSLALQGELLAALLCAYSEHPIPPPEGLKNKELRAISDQSGGVAARLKDINAVRALYDLDDIGEEESDMEDENDESGNENENDESDNDDNDNDDNDDNESDNDDSDDNDGDNEENKDTEKSSAMEEEPTRTHSRVLKTMRRVPNPHRVIDALYVLGFTLSQPDKTLRFAILDVMETVCAFFTSEQITECIVGAWGE